MTGIEHPQQSDDGDGEEPTPLRDLTRRARGCGVDECEEERFSKIGMEFHLIRDHGV